MNGSTDSPGGQGPRADQRPSCEVCNAPLASVHADCFQCGEEAGGVTRREAMRRGAAFAIVAGAAAYGVPMGTVASNDVINYDSELAPDPFFAIDEVSVREHYGDYSELDFVDDDGDERSLTDLGVVIPSENPDTRDEDDEEDKDAWNPVTLRASNFHVDRTKAAPRGAEDDDDDPIYWHDEDHWTTSNASVNEASHDSLEINGNAGGTATFDGDGEIEVTSGLGRKRLSVVMDVDDIDSTGEIRIKVGDGTNYVYGKIDPDGDTDNDEVLADSTGESIHVEPQLSDLEGDVDDLDEISEVQVEFVDEYGELRLYGLDWEREGRTDWGTREFKDEDDEFDTETVRTPEGDFSITTLDTLGVPMSDDDYIRDVKYQAEKRASELPSSHVDLVWEDADRRASGDLTERLRIIWSFEPEAHFDLSWDFDGLHDMVTFDSAHYLEAGYETGHDEEVDIEEYDDDDLNLASVTSDYEDADLDDEIELTSAVSSDEVTAMYLDLRVTPDHKSELEDTVAAVGAPEEEPRGVMDRLFSIPGVILGGLASVFALNRLNIGPFGSG